MENIRGYGASHYVSNMMKFVLLLVIQEGVKMSLSNVFNSNTPSINLEVM
jgi:uncharacterized protein YlbG (UPF0298 family)